MPSRHLPGVGTRQEEDLYEDLVAGERGEHEPGEPLLTADIVGGQLVRELADEIPRHRSRQGDIRIETLIEEAAQGGFVIPRDRGEKLHHNRAFLRLDQAPEFLDLLDQRRCSGKDKPLARCDRPGFSRSHRGGLLAKK